MHHLDVDKKNTLDISEIDLLLMMEMGFFNDLKRKTIELNQKSFSDLFNLKKTTQTTKKEKLVDLHLELAKQIDEIIAKNEKELKTTQSEPITKTGISLPEIIEMREPSIKTPEISTIKTEIPSKSTFSELDQREEFFEIEPPTEITPRVETSNEEPKVQSWMVGDKENKKSFFGLKIKFSTKGKPPEKEQKKINGVTKTKIEIEETKKEIETKKKELEETIKKEKEKELELKRIEEEKRKQEKLRKLELKKKMKEEKINEKEKELELKRIEEEKKKQEKLKKIELKKKMKEEKKAEKELEKKEKIKLFEKKKKEPKTEEKSTRNEDKKLPTAEHVAWDEDLERIFPIIDSLLDKLPEDVVDKFVNSKDFEIYERVMLKYKSK